jgi:hypothetical protein
VISDLCLKPTPSNDHNSFQEFQFVSIQSWNPSCPRVEFPSCRRYISYAANQRSVVSGGACHEGRYLFSKLDFPEPEAIS